MTTIYCILVLAVLDFPISYTISYIINGETDYRFFREHPAISFLQKIITLTVIIIVLLLFSSLLKKIVRVHSLLLTGFISGLIGSGMALTFIGLVYILSSFEWKTNTMGCISMAAHAFLIGFLFPILYRWFSKEPLFHEYFY